MKQFQCDICKQAVREYSLLTLYEGLRSPGTEHICQDCNSELSSIKNAIDAAVRDTKNSWLRKVIAKMKARFGE